ncbi:MAG: endonuclease/exonuclease/phosphatase family protein [Verrucomicrobiota bacterium]|jgi:endonuclease/exonuclease/phosphatase family metal-dependent hydrolase|nr:endonuclease/exonuclease/phosphatase family protein [Verrucomicrobiota bacterium]
MKKLRPAFLLLPAALLLGMGLSAGCSRCDDAATGCMPVLLTDASPSIPQTAEGEFSVMTFNLYQYLLFDRDRNPATLEPKPQEEVDAVVEAIRRVSPDILAVQEIGDPTVWQEFKQSLRQAGVDYPYDEYLRRPPEDRNLALLSRHPIIRRQPHTDDLYTIGPKQFPMRRGILDVEIRINEAYTVRVMTTHLKSKLFHDYGQAEMRRNEARLLCNHVRSALKENPEVNLIVMGDMNDTPQSAPIREITTYQDKAILFDLRPVDFLGDGWTHRGRDDTHERIDYIFVSEHLLPEVVKTKTYVLNLPSLAKGSDHRPLVATFTAAERDAKKAAKPYEPATPHEFDMDE